jgi:Trypsin-like serine proteases, typically periplasmic, contain C-terminal PDZ domain
MSEDKKRKKSLFRRVNRDNVTDTPSNPTQRKDVGYSAYTTPVEKKYNPYSPQAPSIKPPEDPVEETSSKVKKAGFAKFFVIGLVALALIIISSFATYFFSRYDFQLSSGNGVIKLSLIPRTSKPPQTKPSAPVEATPSPPAETPVPTLPLYTKWDGTLMTVGTFSKYSLSLQQIYKKCAPSVVSILAESRDNIQTGSGIIISQNGYIVTNQHFVSPAYSLTVTMSDGKKFTAALVGEDEQTDIAVLKIEASGLTPAEFADYQDLEVGDQVVTIGNMLNQSLSMTNGIITAIHNNASYSGFSTTLLQTNAAVNTGNSGGPLINMSGQVVGITNVALISGLTTIKDIGFAVPASSIKSIVNELLQHGQVTGRPSLGLKLSDIAISAYTFYKLPKGVYVSYVYSASDAYAQGVQSGDVITAVQGIDVDSVNELLSVINSFSVGDSVKIKLYRSGSYITLSLKLIDKANLN